MSNESLEDFLNDSHDDERFLQHSGRVARSYLSDDSRLTLASSPDI